LKRLFPSGKYSDTDIVWKPSYEDYASFKEYVSDDNFCHTKLDTVIKHNNFYYAILTTNKFYKGAIDNCHPCSPIVGIAKFNKTDKGYIFIKFSKNVFQHGAYGDRSIIEIEKFSQTLDLIKVSSVWIGTGSMIEYIDYYSLNSFNPVFSYTSFESNGGMFESIDSRYNETSREMTVHSKEKFKMITKTKYFNHAIHKHELKLSTLYYSFNFETETFDKLCE
jgi:hypothetical protein